MTDVTTSEFGSLNTPTRTLGGGETLNVARGAGIYNSGTGLAVQGPGGNHLNLLGGIYASQNSAAHFTFGNNVIALGAHASAFGQYGFSFAGTIGNNTITNGGQIAGFGRAISFSNESTAVNNDVNNLVTGTIRSGSDHAIWGPDLTINNAGLIEGAKEQFGAVYAVYSLSGGHVTNSGTIRGDSAAVQLGSTATENLVTNTSTGVLIGFASGGIGGFGVSGGDGKDRVVNQGRIEGGGILFIAVSLNGGNDTYIGTGGTLVGAVDGGTGNDTLTGGSFVDVLQGGDNNDTLTGAGGADTLDGGAGNDSFMLNADPSNDTIIDASGIDTVLSTITRSIGTWAFIENLILQGGANINGTGNAGLNSIVGNGGNNILAGLDGNDVLVGGSGNDQLFGQGGKDSLTGGIGNDRFVFQSAAQTAAGLGDVIVDLDDSGDDVMNLTGIIPGVFTFIGQLAFTAANQVRYQQVGANVLVQINTTGPNGAEGEITLLNTTIGNGAIGQVNSADFLL